MAFTKSTSSVTAVLVLVVLSSSFLHVSAWNCNGHAITAQIAVELLEPPVLAYYTTIAQYQMMHYQTLTSIAEISCWPDDIKDFTSQYSPWHYLDQCFNPGDEVPCPTAAEMPHPDITDSLAAAIKRLNSTGITMQERAFWFSFLIHLVGDIHQPLHTTCLFDARWPNGDNGGNAFLLVYNGKGTNVHSFHDSAAGLLAGAYQRPLAKYPLGVSSLIDQSRDLITNQTFDADHDPTNLSIDQWLREGYDAVANHSYSFGNGTLIPFNLAIDATSMYTVQLRSLLQNKLALGGRRLALLLTEIYNSVQKQMN